ncbi:MAG: GGDEF domain-containing protein [Oscillospiraceae bacterium]|nr:GGDEF domain-containing protein [Oscillospiraceae bacterium]
MRRATVIVTALSGVLLIVTLILTCVLPLHYKGNAYNIASDMSSCWRYSSNGQSADPEHLTFAGSSTEVYTFLERNDIQGRSLCFTSRNVVFTVYANDVEIYDFHPQLSGLYGKYYGDQVHMIQLPSFDETMRLRIECTALTVNRWTGFPDMTLEHSGGYLRQLLLGNAGNFCVCMLTFFIGFLLFVLGIVEEFLRKRDMLELISLGVIALTLSVWASFPTHVIQLITDNFAATRVFEHITLIVLPVPVLVFVGSLTGSLKSPLLYLGTSASVANLGLQLIGVGLGYADYHDLLFLSHALIVTGIISVVWLVTQAIRQERLSRDQCGFLISALVSIFITGMVDMVRYYFSMNRDVSQISRIGLFLFVAILTVYEFRKLLNIQSKGEMAEKLRRLALEDSLTGLLNRTAFNHFEEQLKGQSNGRCLFVQLDVNYLKKVNDTYGHTEGDRHIIAAASIIHETFGKYGKVYRVGGDEFVAVLDGADCEREYLQAVTAFRVKQQQYNDRVDPPVKLAIACGMAEYDLGDQNPEAAERLADARMYENKKSLKLANV